MNRAGAVRSGPTARRPGGDVEPQDPDRPPPPPPGEGWAAPDQPPRTDPPASTWGQDPDPWGGPPAVGARGTGRLLALALGSAAVIIVALGTAWIVGELADEGDRDERDVEVAGEDPDAGSDTPGTDGDDGGSPGGESPVPEREELPDVSEPTSPDAELDPPDPSALIGVDATYAQLLVDIDASERTMIGFQEAIVATLLGGSASDPEQLVTALSATAAASAERLEQIRGDLVQPVDDEGASKVRDRYVEHLDTWVEYIRAIQRQPRLLDPGADTDRFTLAINVSAGAFSRELQAQLPPEVDDEVARFADGILDRGFRSVGESQV